MKKTLSILMTIAILICTFVPVLSVSATVGLAVPVTGVTVSPTTKTLVDGNSFQLTATVQPDDASIQTVAWLSSNTSVATVSAGKVTTVSPGTATITVTTTDGTNKAASCAVTVIAAVHVTSITVLPVARTLDVGSTLQLTANILPTTATNKDITWKSNNATYVKVSANGLITALQPTTAAVEITATTDDGGISGTSHISETSYITVIAGVPVTGVTITPTTASLMVGGTQQLTKTISPSNATNQDVIWTSSKPEFATVSSTGLVTAKAEGNATITVTTENGSKTDTCTITVTKAVTNVTGVTLSSTSASLVTGETKQLTVTVLPAEALNKTITWFSSDEDVATVSQTGLITAKSVGKATITVTTENGSKTATCEVTVSKSSTSVTGVTLSQSSASIVSGKTMQLTPTIAPSTASNKSVTWSSSNINVVTVSTGGIVTAKAVGKATITCKSNDDSDINATCLITVIPKTPGSVKAVSVSNKTIKISWSAISGATGYVVYRYSPASASFSRIKVTNSTNTTDTSRLTGKEYYYKVRAYTTVNEANIYGIPSAAFKGKAIPSTPDDIYVSRASGTSIKIRWDAVSGATGYVVYRYFTATKSYERIKVTKATSFTNTSLKTGVTYYYKVRAYQEVGGTNVYGNPSEKVFTKTYK